MRAAGYTRLSIAIAILTMAVLGLAPSAAQASFGFLPGSAGFNVRATAEGGTEPATLAGSHPYSLITEANFNMAGKYSDGDLKDLVLDQPAGLIENPTAVVKCTATQFSTPRVSPFEASLSSESCPATTQIGIVTLKTSTRRRASPRSSASPPMACRSRSSPTSVKPAANTASPWN
jgi:hypothetical protein